VNLAIHLCSLSFNNDFGRAPPTLEPWSSALPSDSGRALPDSTLCAVSKGIRGKYAKRYQEGTNIVKFDEDVRKMFPNTKAVNEASRSIAGIIKTHKKYGLAD